MARHAPSPEPPEGVGSGSRLAFLAALDRLADDLRMGRAAPEQAAARVDALRVRCAAAGLLRLRPDPPVSGAATRPAS